MSLILVDGLKDRPGTGGPKFPNGLHLPAGIGITGDGHINMAGVSSFSELSVSGNVTIGGTLTYEDVTNIDVVGVSTFAGRMNVNSTIQANEGINVSAGVGTFAGDVSIAQKIVHTGDTDTYIDFGTNSIALNAAGILAAQITSDARVGINTNNPQKELEVFDTTAPAVRVNNGSKQADFIVNSTGGLIRTIGSYPLVLNTNQTERARITSGGKIGINTSNPGNNMVELHHDGTDSPTTALTIGGLGIVTKGGVGVFLKASANTSDNRYGTRIHTIREDSNNGASSLVISNENAAANALDEVVRITSAGKVGVGLTNPTEKFEVKSGNIGIVGGSSYKIDTHPLLTYASFSLNTGNYACRVGSTGSSTIRHTQIYGGGSHIATFDGVYNRLGIGVTNPAQKLTLKDATSPTIRTILNDTTVGAGNSFGAWEFESLDSSTGCSGVIGKIDCVANANLDGTAANGSQLRFYTSGTNSISLTEKFRITPTGGSVFNGTKGATGTNSMPFSDGYSALEARAPEGTTQFTVTNTTYESGSFNNEAGMWFKGNYSGNNERAKSAIIHANTADYGVGTLNFCVDGGADNDNAALSDSKLRINTNGNVQVMSTLCLGSSTNTGGAGSGQMGVEYAGDSLNACRFRNTYAGNGNAVQFITSSSEVGSIVQGTGSVTYNTSSDYRLKENQVAISDGITRLKTLKPYRFNWKNDPSIIVDGFFAHEVTAVPEAVKGTKDAVASEDNDSLNIKKGDPLYQQIDHSKLVPLLTAALQEAIAEIETLKAKVAALESN